MSDRTAEPMTYERRCVDCGRPVGRAWPHQHCGRTDCETHRTSNPQCVSVETMRAKIEEIVKPWIGVTADLIPREVMKLVVLLNETADRPADEPSAVHRKWPGEPPHCPTCGCGLPQPGETIADCGGVTGQPPMQTSPCPHAHGFSTAGPSGDPIFSKCTDCGHVFFDLRATDKTKV